MRSALHFAATLALALSMTGCNARLGPPRDSAVLENTTDVPSEVRATDLFDGHTYALSWDGRVFDVADPSTTVVDASSVVEGAYPDLLNLRMASRDRAYVSVDDASGRALHLLGGGTSEVTRSEDIAPLVGEDWVQIEGFDVGPDGTLWISAWSWSSAGAVEPDTFEVCARPVGGAFACTTASAPPVDRASALVVAALADGAMVGGDGLYYASGDTITALPMPERGTVDRLDSLDSDHALVRIADQTGAPLAYYSVDPSGAAELMFGGVAIDSWGTEMFVRGPDDVLFVTWDGETVPDCSPLSLSTCRSYAYVWQQYVVMHWNGEELVEVGHADVEGDAGASAIAVFPRDERAFFLTTADRVWAGTR